MTEIEWKRGNSTEKEPALEVVGEQGRCLQWPGSEQVKGRKS